MTAQEQDGWRVGKAKEHLSRCREIEIEARRKLAEAAADTARAKEKYESMFQECEARTVARIRANQN